MSVGVTVKPTVKQKIKHEFVEFAGIALYLAFFFCSVAAYKSLLLKDHDIPYFAFGAALLNAIIVAKVILIGEYAHLGKGLENKALLVSSLYKAILFSALVFVFHIVEEAARRLIHQEGLAGALREVRFDDLLARSLIVFCTFLPLFAFRELRRVMGEERFHELFFKTGTNKPV
jgi:hypothetical protein